MIKRLYRLCPDRGILIRLSVLHAALAILQVTLLGFLVPVLRALIQPSPDFTLARSWLISGAAGLFAYVILTVIATPVGFSACMKLAAQLRHRLMQHITTMPLGWFTADHKARLARSITADAGNIAQLAVTIGAPSIVATLVPLCIIILVFAINWQMALLFLIIAPIAFITLQRAGRIASIAEVELERAATEIAGRAIELGQAQSVLRAAGHHKTGSLRMQKALREHHLTYRKGLRCSLVPDLTYIGVVMTGFISVLFLATILLLKGIISIPDTIVLLILAIRFLEPLGSLIEFIGALRAMDNSINRVQAILNTQTLPKSLQPAYQIKNAAIEFSEVSFSYGKTMTLKKVSFQCCPGSTTALVGASGSGKTTVIRLIARFFDVGSGSIKVGGVDVRELDNATLMSDLAIIFQDVYLFDTTIQENLLLACPDASSEALAAAAKAAQLDELINRLPNGWHTRVGEGGAQLSGGERQRVSIARAFLKKARIVLIDEASSALDPENERAIGKAIANLTNDPERTVIIIAHRPATLAAADQVITLDNGCVIERGSPNDLLRTNGTFAKLFNQYEQAKSWHITSLKKQAT